MISSAIQKPWGVPRTPAMDLYYRISRDVLRMPGVRSMSFWGPKSPSELGINVFDERAAQAIRGVLEPTLDGISLNVYVPGSREPYTGPMGSLKDRISVIDALTGVWEHRATIMPRGSGTVVFKTVNQGVIDRLDPIIQNRFNVGVDPRGWTKWVGVRWKAELPPA